MVTAQGHEEIAMITALQGSVALISAQGTRPLQPFSKLKQGDSLLLEGPALLKLIYFNSGRQETWRGNGTIEILGHEGKGSGLPIPDNFTLSRQTVKQIAKTPTESTIQKNTMKLRSFGAENSIDRIEESYQKMRMEAVRGDLNPELYLLSALFEMREIERVEQVLADLRASRPADQEAKVVIALYQKALKNLKEGSGK
ncbi:MAG: hypothetical protein WCK63_14750 [Betaproteobacteria bacterium]